MRGVCAPYIDEAPWCIRLDEDADDIEIKSGVIHHLPKFGGMPDENPLRHLKEFHGVCMSMKSASVPEDIFKLKTFPFSLVSQAKSWLMSLPSGSITSWDQMQRKFMDKYYSHSKVAQTRKELSLLRQGRAKTLFDYMERFRALLDICGWPGLLTLYSDADVDDTCEFLTGYHYIGPKEYEGFKYTFRGVEHHCTMMRLRQIFGWPEVEEGTFVNFSHVMEISDTYFILTGTGRYRPSDASVASFTDPFWYLLHFILTRTLTARANGNDKPSIRDLTLLGSLVRGVVPH
ncbi:unnamed protein product [Rhodiola kirilowii]